MPHFLRAIKDRGVSNYSVTNIFQLVQGEPPRESLNFPALKEPPGSKVTVAEKEGALVMLNVETNRIVTTSFLLTCAAVVYLNTQNKTAYVYHANAGYIHDGAFREAMNAIQAGTNYRNVLVLYAHPNGLDQIYEQSINDLIRYGIPDGNIVEIYDLMIPYFAINNFLQVGYGS